MTLGSMDFEQDTLHVVVIAHPDDESMFFIPTIRALCIRKQRIWLVCMTTGNYDGLGGIRRDELLHVGTTVLGFENKVMIAIDKDSENSSLKEIKAR